MRKVITHLNCFLFQGKVLSYFQIENLILTRYSINIQKIKEMNTKSHFYIDDMLVQKVTVRLKKKRQMDYETKI